MAWLIIFGLMALNYFISIINAVHVGVNWRESKVAGIVPHLFVWMVGIMSASGFTWVYMFLMALAMMFVGKLDFELVDGFLSLGYIVIVPGVLISGLAILLHSWIVAYRERTLANFGMAGWNTFANAYNLVNAARGMPIAFKSVVKLLQGKKISVILAIAATVLAVAGGILTTYAIARVAANSTQRKFKERYMAEKRKRSDSGEWPALQEKPKNDFLDFDDDLWHDEEDDWDIIEADR